MIGQDQIREGAGLVEEAAEADDERDLVERFANLPGARRGEDRVRAVDEQHLRASRQRLPSEYRRQPVQRAAAAAARPALGGRADSSCGVKNTPPGCSTLPTSAFSALTAKRGEQRRWCGRAAAPPTIATAGARSANSRASRSIRPPPTPVISSTCVRRVIRQARRPSRDEPPARPAPSVRTQLVAHDHVRDAEREHAFGARLDRRPTRPRSRRSATSALRPARTGRGRRGRPCRMSP